MTFAQLRSVYAAWEDEFRRNRDLHGDRIRCRPGCSDCCHQIFQISELEAAEISRGLKHLSGVVASRLRAKAVAYLPMRQELLARLGSGAQEAWGSLPPAGARLACPALDDEGCCSIYEFRPLICRRFGVPLWNPDRPGRVYACELNFRAGEEIEDNRLIQIQTGLHREWKGIQAQYNEAGGQRDLHPITIARAILEDFHALLY